MSYANISSTTITSQTPEIDTTILDEKLANLNAQNKTEEEILPDTSFEDIERQQREEARLAYLKERAEKERIERERIRKEEEEAELEQQLKKNSFFNKLLGKTKPQTSQDEEESEIEFEDATETLPTEEEPSTEAVVETEEDKTKKKKKNKEPDYEYLATHDGLTGLLNMVAYEQTVAKIKNTDGLTVLFMDINDLKRTNDSFGHAKGNTLILTCVEAMKSQFGEDIYRIGGDEFVVLLKKATDVDAKIKAMHAFLKEKSNADTDGVIYSISVGVATGEKGDEFSKLQEAADNAMYKAKQKYKEKRKKEEEEKAEKTKPTPDHDELLTDDQRMLKSVIQSNHEQANADTTQKIISEIQRRHDEISAILIASPTFDYLFIIEDVEVFMAIIGEADFPIDYSYLYIVYDNGTQFYGIDEYYDEVTDLFKEIGKTLVENGGLTSKSVSKIKGINIFKDITLYNA